MHFCVLFFSLPSHTKIIFLFSIVLDKNKKKAFHIHFKSIKYFLKLILSLNFCHGACLKFIYIFIKIK